VCTESGYSRAELLVTLIDMIRLFNILSSYLNSKVLPFNLY